MSVLELVLLCGLALFGPLALVFAFECGYVYGKHGISMHKFLREGPPPQERVT